MIGLTEWTAIRLGESLFAAAVAVAGSCGAQDLVDGGLSVRGWENTSLPPPKSLVLLARDLSVHRTAEDRC